MKQAVEKMVMEALEDKHEYTVDAQSRQCISAINKDTFDVRIHINEKLDNLSSQLYRPLLESILIDVLEMLEKLKNKEQAAR